MAEILNLRRFRKVRQRSEDEARASLNRAAFGRSKQECAATQASSDQAARLLDAHRLEEGRPPQPDPAAADE